MAAKLPELIFTPSTKAEIGDHDVNISFEKMIEILGEEYSISIKDISLKIFKDA